MMFWALAVAEVVVFCFVFLCVIVTLEPWVDAVK